MVLALGFGVFLMGTLYQVQHNILRTLDVRIGEARANVVFFDVQDAQRAGIDSIMRAGAHELIDETPIVPMRISSINGRPVAEILAAQDSLRRLRAANGGRGRGGGGPNGGRGGPWALRREFRSTFRDTLTASEHLVAGKWFGARRGPTGSARCRSTRTRRASSTCTWATRSRGTCRECRCRRSSRACAR